MDSGDPALTPTSHAFSVQPSPSTDAPKGHPASSWLNQGPRLMPSSSSMLSIETLDASRYWRAPYARGGLAWPSLRLPAPMIRLQMVTLCLSFPATLKPGWTLPTVGTACRKQALCFIPADASLLQDSRRAAQRAWGHLAQCKIRAPGISFNSWTVQLRGCHPGLPTSMSLGM